MTWAESPMGINDKHRTLDRHYILCIWIQLQLPCSDWVLVAQWIECPPRCQEVMGLIAIRDSDVFLCPTLVSCWSLHFSHFPCFFHQFACWIKKKSHFLKTWQIYVVLLKERNVTQDRKHMCLTIGLGAKADLSIAIFPSNCKVKRKTVLSFFFPADWEVFETIEKTTI